MGTLARFGLVVTAAVALAACGAEAPPPAASPSAAPSASASATPCASVGSTEAQQSDDPTALSGLGAVAMRVGQHDCSERFVFEMAGEGEQPGWRVGYQDPLILDPSGEEADLLGDAQLEIVVGVWTVLDPAISPVPGLPAFTGPEDIQPSGFQAIQEAKFLGAFEGVTQIGLGIDQERAFHAYWLDEPARLVVDVEVP